MAEEVKEKMEVSETETEPTKEHDKKPKDLLQRFSQPTKVKTKEENNSNNINLGLSLGGIYCENSIKKSLCRSSSIIGMMTVDKEDREDQDFKLPLPRSYLSLARSCSVLTEAEQEQRKASFMALAKTRLKSFVEGSSSSSMRNTTQNGVVPVKEKSSPTGPMPSSPSKVAAWAAASAARSPALCRALLQIRRHASLNGDTKFEGKQGLAEQKVAIRSQSFPPQKHKPSKIMLWTSPYGKPESKVMPGTSPYGKPESKVVPGAILNAKPESKVVPETILNAKPESKVMLGTSSNGKSESKAIPGTSSDVISESKAMLGTGSNVTPESKVMLGTSTYAAPDSKIMLGASSYVNPESKIIPGTSSFAKPEQKIMLGTSSNGEAVQFGETKLQNPPKRVKLLHNGFQDTGMEVMRQMPSVTTIGDGPNGRKIEGFLYKYRRGQVSIVCVCHGSFFSPAEFVRHAGGIDVANPMKRITVCPTFSF